MRIIDLSVPITEQTPVYPGDPSTKIAPAGQIDQDGYTDHYVSLGTHVGTHMDAPNHMLKEGVTLDKVPVDQFVGRGVYVKVEGEFSVKQLEAAGIQAGDIVLLHTGLSDRYQDLEYFETYPAMSQEVADYLVAKKVKIVGLDTCSPDHDEFIAHRTLLAGNVLIVENLTNLAALAGQKFTVYALPIKLELDGAPTRVIAVVE